MKVCLAAIGRYQQQYIDDYERSGAQSKAGNGGFFHSCYLGSFFHSGWGGTAIWNIIEIGGVTMQKAISNWWHESATPAAIRCMPQVESCPGGSACPASGLCPEHTHAKLSTGLRGPAAWTTDCTWDPIPQEPPLWTNKTCEDWQYNENSTGKPGCYVNSCCPPEDGGCKYFSCTREIWEHYYFVGASLPGISSRVPDAARPPWGCKWFCNPSCGEIQVGHQLSFVESNA